MVGPLLRLTPFNELADMRPFRAGDLEQCARILDLAYTDFDWRLVWSPQYLADELNDPASETLVFDPSGGGIRR
jgi:hypothetical protein